MTVPNTHDIDKLVRMSVNNGSRVELTDWIEEKTDMLTRWETDTRYDMDYCVEQKKVQPGSHFEWNCMYQVFRKKIAEE